MCEALTRQIGGVAMINEMVVSNREEMVASQRVWPKGGIEKSQSRGGWKGGKIVNFLLEARGAADVPSLSSIIIKGATAIAAMSLSCLALLLLEGVVMMVVRSGSKPEVERKCWALLLVESRWRIMRESLKHDGVED
jgi:hypothetical protein